MPKGKDRSRRNLLTAEPDSPGLRSLACAFSGTTNLKPDQDTVVSVYMCREQRRY